LQRAERLGRGQRCCGDSVGNLDQFVGVCPWSPLPLTVEVIAQIVAVPSPLLRPMMLRSPSVAGDQGSMVTKLFPEG